MRASTVLVGAYDGGVDHHIFVVVITRQQLENTLENATLCPSIEALIDNLPVPETLRQIAPGNPRPVPVQHRINKQSIVGCGATDMPLTSGQKILDPIPLVVA